MIDKVECPNCNHIFAYNGEPMIQCPSCEIHIEIQETDDPFKIQIAYTDSSEPLVEVFEVYEQLDSLDDDSLCDELSFILSHYEFPLGVEEILVENFENGELSEESRRKAEGAYVLAYTIKGMGDKDNVN